MTTNTELIARLRLGASISRERKLNQGYDAVADEAADAIEALIAERDALQAEIAQVKEVEFPAKVEAVVAGWKLKCERLEAQLAAAHGQEPVAYVDKFNLRFLKDCHGDESAQLRYANGFPNWVPANVRANYLPLYAAPIPQQPRVPEGWKLVPIVPTSEMIEAAVDRFFAEARPQHRVNAHYTWDAMLAAAPQPKEPK